MICLLLAAAVITTFLRVGECDFISYDDFDYVANNSHIQGGIGPEAIGWALTSGYAGNWHPLTWISHILDVQLLGLNPHWHHLMNLLFHVANTLLLFTVLDLMTNSPWKSAFVAALFGLHPLHVESVAWVAERKDVLSTFFWMLTMAAYVRYAERPRKLSGFRLDPASRGTAAMTAPSPQPRERSVVSTSGGRGRIASYLAVVISFALGLTAKPMLATLPFVLLLLDWWPLGRMREVGYRVSDLRNRTVSGDCQVPDSGVNEPVLEKKKKRRAGKKHATGPRPVPEANLAAGPRQTLRDVESGGESEGHAFRRALVLPLIREKIPLFILAAISCTVTYAVQQKSGAVQSAEVFPPGVRIANALVSYVIYMAKTVWPANLGIFYPHPGMRPLWQVFGSAVITLGITLIVIREARRFPYLAFGWFWFTGTLVPVSGIVQVGAQAMADRYMYIPSIGLFIALAWGVPELLGKLDRRGNAPAVISACVLAFLSVVSWRQTGYWKDSIALYDHTLEVTGNNDRIHYNRAEVYQRLGNLQQAISDYDRTIEINPKYVDAYLNRGVAYRNIGNMRQAISDYDRAIEIDPGQAPAFYNRGIAYGRLGNYRQAIEDYGRAIEAGLETAEPYYNRGLAYAQLGDYRKAIENYDRAVYINPGYASAYNNRGLARLEIGDRGQAIEDFMTAARLNNENAKNFLKSHGIDW